MENKLPNNQENAVSKPVDDEETLAKRLERMDKVITAASKVFSDALEPVDKTGFEAFKQSINKATENALAILNSLPQFAKRLEELNSVGTLNTAPKVAQWLQMYGYEEQEPQDCLAIIFGATTRAIKEEKDILKMLPIFAKNAEQAAANDKADSVTIYDLLRSYSIGEYDIDRPISITAIKAEKLLYPLDTVNTKVWQALTTGIEYPIKAEKDGSEQRISIYYSIDFVALKDDIAISNELTQFDKRVYIACAALHDAGNEYTTLSKIYETMGYSGRPSPEHIEKIDAALTKMGMARINVHNQEEAAKYHYPLFVYDGALLPFERVSAIVNGKTTEASIHIFRQPPLITFAQQRKQLTTIDARVLQSPINKTELNLAIDDYLIGRISRAASGRQPNRILYKTLYENVGITTKKQKQRAPEKIKTYLQHYKKCNLIAGYSMETDGITVMFANPSLLSDNKKH